MSVTKASFRNPESGQTVGTFVERCHHDGSATATVTLTSPQTISGTQRLEVYSTLKDEAIISVSADGVSQKTVHELEGTSSLGCLPKGTGVSLVRTPGGKLGTLLEVLGNGTIEPEPG